MTRAGTQKTLRQERFAAADKVIAAGGTLRRYARAIDLTPAGALKWLRANDPDRLAALVDGRRSQSSHEVLVKLLLMKSVEGMRGGQARLARAFGTSSANLCGLRNRWAPDGIDAAIADLMPEDAHV